MSPEHSKPNYSDGWRKHLRKERTAQNKLKVVTPEDRQRKFTTASWTAVRGLLNLETSNNRALHSVYEELYEDGPIREIVKGYYDAGYKDATSGNGREAKNRDKFMKAHLDVDSLQPLNPIQFTRSKPLLKMVDSYLFRSQPNPKKSSR